MEPIQAAVLAAANAKSRKLRNLVLAPEILVMPGAYDVLSALLFQQLGFEAIQCTSGGIAAALGYPDGEVISRDLFIQVTASFAAAVSVPVNADGEKGYGDEEGVKETVRSLVSAGVAGMNLEDSLAKSRGGLVELPQQLRKIQSVMDTKRELGSEFFSQRAGGFVSRHHRRPKESTGRSDSTRQRLRRSGRRLYFLFKSS
jgi:2-methylisocitrate lyase-like PEP mutase family enzyme